MIKILQSIFSVKNIEKHKLITILGLKIKIKYTKRKPVKQRIEELEAETKLLRSIIKNSIDITKIPPAHGNFRTVQLIKVQLLELVGHILKKNHIQYWVDYGTLIGVIRHHGFIPWDDDIDICLLKDDYLKLPLIFKEVMELGKNFNPLYGWKGYEIDRLFYKEFCLDFFPMEYLNENCKSKEEKMNFKEKWENARKQMLKASFYPPPFIKS